MKVDFTLNRQNELKLEYEGKTSKTTVVNMTNHTYWNMSGNFKRNLYPQLLKINALSYLPVIDMVYSVIAVEICRFLPEKSDLSKILHLIFIVINLANRLS